MEIVGDFLVRGGNSCQTRGTMVKRKIIGCVRIPYKPSSFLNNAASGIDSFLNKINEVKIEDKKLNI